MGDPAHLRILGTMGFLVFIGVIKVQKIAKYWAFCHSQKGAMKDTHKVSLIFQRLVALSAESF